MNTFMLRDTGTAILKYEYRNTHDASEQRLCQLSAPICVKVDVKPVVILLPRSRITKFTAILSAVRTVRDMMPFFQIFSNISWILQAERTPLLVGGLGYLRHVVGRGFDSLERPVSGFWPSESASPAGRGRI